MGHALELGRANMPVEWRHDGSHYQLTPHGDGRKPRNVLACPSGRGEWSSRLG